MAELIQEREARTATPTDGFGEDLSAALRGPPYAARLRARG